jgi:aldehyde dehydrogenase
MKPAETTPASMLVLMELIGDLFPAGTLNIVNGLGRDVGAALSNSTRIAKIAFTGSTPTGKMIAHAAAENLIPATLELGGKSPNIFFQDVMDHDDDYLDKALEGFTLFALNQGQICSCPSRALVHESIYDKFMERVLPRVKAIRQGNPLDPETMMGAQNSLMQQNKILEYIDIGRNEDKAQLLTGGARPDLGSALGEGFYVQPTVFRGDNNMRIFREEIFGPVLTVTTFKDEAEALAIANDTEFGLGSGVWSRNGNICHRVAKGLQAGRVWVNCYHVYPAGAAFGGYKKSGIGRETHKMVLEHYQQTKNVLTSYSEKKLGFF